MGIVLALLLLLGGMPAGAETIRVGITVHAGEGLPTVPGLQAGLLRLFTAEYGSFASLTFEPGAPAGAVAQVDIAAQGDLVAVSTSLTRSGPARALSSTVPAGAQESLLSTVTGDLAFLQFSAGDFADFPPSPPPRMIGLLPTDLLSSLLPGSPEDLEPVGLASGGNGVTVSFPHGYLTLGPQFRITGETVRDIFAQSGGREPLLISGVARGATEDVYLLSEQAKKIVVLNPRVGSRQVVDAPGLSAPVARPLDPETIAVLSDARGGAGVALYSLKDEKPRLLSTAASWVSALAADSRGNLWVWDVGERRIRVIARGGREVSSVKPLFKASLMPLPQQMEVLGDGSFLLGGSGELWKFESTGIPVWRLSRLPGRPSEQLPASFALAVNGADGSIVMLDAPSRRLLSFSQEPAGDTAGLAPLFERLDTRRLEDVQEGAALAAGAGLTLLRLQFDTLLARRGGAGAAATAAARLDVLREKLRGAAQLADGLARDLLVSRAEGACLLAAGEARALLAEAPDDTEAAAILQAVLSRREELRAALGPQTQIGIVSAAVSVTPPGSNGTGIEVALRLRNQGNAPLSRLRVHVNLPAITLGPSLAGFDELGPGEERKIVVPLSPGPGWAGAPVRPFLLAVLVTWERGSVGFTAAFSLAVTPEA